MNRFANPRLCRKTVEDDLYDGPPSPSGTGSTASEGHRTSILTNPRSVGLLVVFMSAAAVVTTTGCIGLTANLIHAWTGNVVEPEFDGLKERRVAVVCITDSTSYGPSPLAQQLAQAVEQVLQRNVEDIEIIEQSVLDDWKDVEDWDQTDYRKIGEGVDAETVLAVEVASFRLHEGQTMYKGRAEVSVAVYDMTAEGKRVFNRTLPQLTFPANGAFAATDTTDASFRRRFVQFMAREVAKLFYPYDVAEDFAQDTSLIAR